MVALGFYIVVLIMTILQKQMQHILLVQNVDSHDKVNTNPLEKSITMIQQTLLMLTWYP